ncbi:MAG: glycosyltransferase, partial [Candidatus Cloacimonadaceae bacterium]
MHVLILPSWYPAQGNSAGLFILEQAKALAKHSDVKVSIINWGPNEFVVKIRNPIASLRTLTSFKSNSEEVIRHSANLTEYKIPHLTWTSLVSKGNYLALVPRLISTISQIETADGKIDLIHAHVSFPAGFLAYYISKHLSLPYIITEHSGPFPFKEYLSAKGLRDIVALPLSAASELIAVSSVLAESIFPYASRLPLVIPNSVDTDFFNSDLNQPYNQIPQLFTLSQLTVSKGIGDVLKAVQILKGKGYKFVLKIGGDGRQSVYLKRLSESLNLSDYVVWLGGLNRQEALTEYQSCDFYVMPSRLESLSMVILEAMACARPVVSTACGGPVDLIQPETGILTEPANPVSLANGMATMLETYHKYDRAAIR